MATEAQDTKELRDPLDALEPVEDGSGSVVDPHSLPVVQKLLAGEWDVYETYELTRVDDTGPTAATARYIAWRASTWMINPNARRSDYVPEFARAARRALRDFACWPTAVEEPWLRDPSVLDRCFDETRSSPFEDDNEEEGVLREDFQPDDDFSYYVHIDLSTRRDAAGLAMGHWDDDAGETGKCIVDLHMRFIAPETENLDFRKIRAIVYELAARGFDIQEVTLDKWNSADTIAEFKLHDLEAREISDAEQLDSYDGLLELLIFNMISFYSHEVLDKELRQLQWKRQRLDHPESGSKDIADAVSVVGTQCRNAGSNLVAFSGSRTTISREEAAVASSEQRDRLLGLDSGEDRMMGVV